MNKKSLIGFNKFTIIFVLIYFLCVVGASYTYFAFNYENSSTIVGNVVGVDATLTVERVVGTDEKLVPMMDDALSNALNAVGTIELYAKDGTKSGAYSSLYNGGLDNNHYTCFTTGDSCTSVYYVYFTEEAIAYYMTLTNGKKIENILEEMLNYNTTSSTIKGDDQTSGSLDRWYANNIEDSYGYYIEDTVWCNDRTIAKLNGWDPDGGMTTDHLRFGTWNRLVILSKPDLSCERELDSFTVDEENGNGDLDYSVGLLAGDELMLAGGGIWNGEENKEYYLYSGSNYWTGSPYRFYYYSASCYVGYSPGNLFGGYIYDALGVRPSISLKHGFTIADNNADGSVDKPYIVE